MPDKLKKNGYIEIKGARENNLKNIDVSIPRNKFTVVTGLSGSGKSSLALDTIHKEGLRRYIDCMSTYARQFLERVEKPEFDDISGLPTPIAIESRNNVKNSRSTVGTTTEIYDYIRLLFAKIGKIYCPGCKEEIKEHSPQSICTKLTDEHNSERCIISFPADNDYEISHYMKKGYSKVLVEGKTFDIEEHDKKNNKTGNTNIIVDRMVINPKSKSRITEALETAFEESKAIYITVVGKGEFKFTKQLSCDKCEIQFRKPSPNLFSFNSPYGACEQCKGFGNNLALDPELIVPNSQLSLSEGAIEPFTKPSYKHEMRKLINFADENNIDTYIPFYLLDKQEVDLIFNGNSNYYGIRGYFKRLERKNYKMHIRVFLSKYRSAVKCEFCRGSRLKDEALFVKISDKDISQLSSMSVKNLARFFKDLKLEDHDKAVAGEILKEINSRISFLIDVGLDYLTLSRLTRSLSGGEAQRINLACQLGSRLTETLYILDEPSIGLHSRDLERLNSLILELKSRDNTVILIEHDLDTIGAADYILELGPRSGNNGGEIVYQGTKNEFLKSSETLTKKYLTGEISIQMPKKRRGNSGRTIKIINASENNLQNIDVEIPLGIFVCVTGVSGSGKSSLINDVLYTGLSRKFNNKVEKVGKHDDIAGTEYLSDVVILDQSSIGKSSRSNPATYIKVYDDIRKVLAGTLQAKLKDFTPSHFSFNVEGGRCDKCKGEGTHTVDMHFLADVQVTCDQCNGMRFKQEILNYKFQDKNISEILDLTVDDSITFFSDFPAIGRKLKILSDVGLGYLRLGQPALTLSGGESQRIKIARELGRKKGDNILYILDEPTVGLHMHDISRLLRVLNKLVDNGNSIVMIEHNLELIKCADYIIDLGPEGGDKGGKIVASGTPDEIIQISGSYTGKYLKQLFSL